MTYVDRVRDDLLRQIPSISKPLLDLYTMLALVKGEQVTYEDIHHAWSVWTRQTEPNHPYMVPFDQLPSEVEELDKPRLDAIKATAAKMRQAPRST